MQACYENKWSLWAILNTFSRNKKETHLPDGLLFSQARTSNIELGSRLVFQRFHFKFRPRDVYSCGGDTFFYRLIFFVIFLFSLGKLKGVTSKTTVASVNIFLIHYLRNSRPFDATFPEILTVFKIIHINNFLIYQ